VTPCLSKIRTHFGTMHYKSSMKTKFQCSDWKGPTNDGGRKILGYTVEMYDLPTGNWVTVTQTEGI
jgi:hypothetical protein